MNRLIPGLVLSLFLSPAWAVICKQVDAEGVVSYSDLPPDECPQPVRLPEYSRYVPRAIAAPPPPVRRVVDPLRETGGVYRSLGIDRPQPGSSIQDSDGRLEVSLTVQPELRQGDGIRLLLDGAEVLDTGGTSGIVIGNVARGRHSLQAMIVAPDGRQLIASPVVTFYMHRPTESQQEAVAQREAARLTEAQSLARQRLEQERQALRERTRRDIQAQRQRVQQQRQSDFSGGAVSPRYAPADGTSSAYTPLPQARNRTEERYTQEARDLLAPSRQGSTRRTGELAEFDPLPQGRSSNGEASDFNRANAPGSAPIPSYSGSHPAYAPNFTPPSR